MYHGRFKNTHYQTGFDWGEMLRKHGNFMARSRYMHYIQTISMHQSVAT